MDKLLGQIEAMDKYRSYQQLMMWEKEGRDFSIHVREGFSGLAVIAPHGGGIEPGTMELAEAIAGEVHSFYCLEGIKRAQNADLHLTSEYFNEPKAVDIVKTSQTVLALHGCKGQEEVVYLGGRDVEKRERIGRSLTKAGFTVEMSPRPQIQGKSRMNICNRCPSGMGVQLEIASGLRKRMFSDLTRRGRQRRTETFHRFVSAIREAIG
jgi:phage replication-related protein YjqB (UPF0714/DUF867 family)